MPSHVLATFAARSAAVAYLPPPIPSVPTKSVSQNWQMARLPVLLTPGPQVADEKRQNTAARPACAPSPCSV